LKIGSHSGNWSVTVADDVDCSGDDDVDDDDDDDNDHGNDVGAFCWYGILL